MLLSLLVCTFFSIHCYFRYI